MNEINNKNYKDNDKNNDSDLENLKSLNTLSKKENKSGNFIYEFLKFLVISLAIVIPIRTFIAQPFIVNGASMDPTFETGQYLIVDQLSYNFSNPQRGDVIIMRYPKDPKTFFIKRMLKICYYSI